MHLSGMQMVKGPRMEEGHSREAISRHLRQSLRDREAGNKVLQMQGNQRIFMGGLVGR